jgi:hypothetical protein
MLQLIFTTRVAANISDFRKGMIDICCFNQETQAQFKMKP